MSRPRERLLMSRLRATSRPDDAAAAHPDEAPWLPYLLSIPAVALGALVVYAWRDWDMLAVAVLLAGGAFAAGGLLGFLFGIPRALAGSEGAGEERDARSGYRPNTNLEQISD